MNKNITDTTASKQPDTNMANETAAALPADYLKDGYYATTDKDKSYLRPEYVGAYAETMANILAEMKPSDFSGLLREMKRNKKTALPFEARLTAALEMLPKSLSLICRKKAPPALVSFIKHNLDNIKNDADWVAFYRHMEAIFGFLSIQQEEPVG